MPRILVADDNSNIQRMVATALQGPGVEVVAVGNGDAAIRKLPGMDADLVLADIFMPVRNGYEVCEFIKKDPRFSHIPVVLLVGAFDPLDEVEAQRVSADGILKKPFVPPDPLVNMVKSLLAKSAGERLVAVAVPVAVSVGEAQSAESRSPSHVVGRSSVQDVEPLPLLDEFSDAPPEEFPAPDSGVNLGRREKPLAFRPLVETPGVPGVDDADLIVTASRDPVLGEPAFWTQAAPAEEAETDEALQEHTWGNSARPLPMGDEGDLQPSVQRPDVSENGEHPGVKEIGLRDLDVAPPEFFADETHDDAAPQANEPAHEPTHNIEFAPIEQAAALPDATEPAPWETKTSNPSKESAAEESSSTVNSEAESPDIASPLFESWLGESRNSVSHALATESAPAPEVASSEDADKEASHAEVSDVASSNSHSIPNVEEPPAWLAPVMPIFPGSESLWASKPESLADTQEVIPGPPEHDPAKLETKSPEPKPEPKMVWPPVFEPVTERSVLEKNAISTFSAELAEAVVPVAESELAKAAAKPPSESVLASMTPVEAATAASPAPPNPEMVEAMVTRIVDRMQPKVIEVVTREILRPLVEALVRREIEKQ